MNTEELGLNNEEEKEKEKHISFITGYKIKRKKTKAKEKSTLKENIKKVIEIEDNALKELQNTPYDGMATHQVYPTIKTCLNREKLVSPKWRTQEFIENHFPLINVVSKRKVLNNSNKLLGSLIASIKLPCEKRHFRPKEKSSKYFNDKYEAPSNLVSKRKKEIEDDWDFENNIINQYLRGNRNQRRKRCDLCLSNNSTTRNVYFSEDKPLRTEGDEMYLRKLDNPSNFTHFCSLKNTEYIYKKKNKRNYNYARNAYKIIQEDPFISRVTKDVSHLKFNNNLKLMEYY